MVLSLQSFGQKLNVISISPPIGRGSLMYPIDPNSKDLYNKSIQLFVDDTFALVIDQERNANLQFDMVHLYKWQVALDLYLLKIAAINPLNTPRIFTSDSTSQNDLFRFPRIDLLEKNYKLGDSLELTDIPSSLRPKTSKNPLLGNVSLDMDVAEPQALEEPILPSQIDSFEEENELMSNLPLIDLGYTGVQKQEKICLNQGGCQTPTKNIKIYKDAKMHNVTVLLKNNKYSFRFQDNVGQRSSLSEFQADINSSGQLVFVRRLFDLSGNFISSEIVHINSGGEKVNQISSKYDLDRETVLVDFENDSIALIQGLINDKENLIYFGRYNVETKELKWSADKLPKAQVIGPNISIERNITHKMIDNILGYRPCYNGYYLLFGVDHRVGSIPYLVNRKDKDFLKLISTQKKIDDERLTSRKQGIYIVKIGPNGKPEWVNGLTFREAIIGGFGVGNDFPIFLTDHKRSDFAGVPYISMITTNGVKYLEPAYELIQEGYGMLTGIVHLEGSEYLGIATTFPYVHKYYNGFFYSSSLSFSYSVIRFEVYD